MVNDDSYVIHDISNHEQIIYKERKREKKQKKKKKSKILKIQCNDSDFSEEDEIPLAAQLECSTESLKNRLSNEEEQEDESEKNEAENKIKNKTYKR